jgi:diaminopimelate epimerase
MTTAYKFHGAGNDFIMIDDFENKLQIPASQIVQLCNRHTGIGADGLIVIKQSSEADFRMLYYNADGSEADMCGNGARCSMAFAFMKKYCRAEATFEASDGLHNGKILQEKNNEWQVKITLRISGQPQKLDDGSYFANTGVPHNIRIVDNLQQINVRTEGALHRNNLQQFPEGANINFVSLSKDSISIRTYERGVEDETLACGTGITAAALVAHTFIGYAYPVTIHAAGGTLNVDEQNGVLWLEGPARHAFTAQIHSLGL